MDERAQGALEYLLLIGGAVLIAAIVIVLVSGMSGTSSGATTQADTEITGGIEHIQHILTHT